MDAAWLDVAALVARWLHLITGIAWIGASFYFIWLDNSLQAPPAWKAERGVQGDLWSFHGGGIYEVAKYRAGPPEMPERLHWFYWEAYSTWITGMALLIIVYYLRASGYLVGDEKWLDEPLPAIAASLGFIASGVLVYEVLLRSGLANNPRLFAAVLWLLLLGYSWLASGLFADRAAYLHVGVLIGTIMVANVFIGIIPPQRAFVRAVEAGGELPVEGLARAKQRSTHNNYFTLPVLFCMISNHYPLYYGHPRAWLVLALIVALTAYARQFFNLRHRGVVKPGILAVSAAGFLLLSAWLVWDTGRAASARAGISVSDAEGLALAASHCQGCHARNPTQPGFAAAPLGLYLESRAEFINARDRSIQAIASGYMPLGNMTQMSSEERERLLAWLQSL